MNGIKEIRVKAGMSQYQLAEYLGVSRSLVSHAENGLRDLPSAAYKKLIILLKLQNGSAIKQPVEPTVPQKQINKAIEKAMGKINSLQYRIAILQKKLDKVKKAHAKSLLALQTNKGLAEHESKDERPEIEKAWMLMHENDSKVRNENNSVARQVMLRLRIELLKAQVKVYYDFIPDAKLFTRYAEVTEI